MFGLSRWLSGKDGEGSGTPLQYSSPEYPMDGGAWWTAVHGVTKSWTRLSDFTFTFHYHTLEKEMATHSSVLAWRIPQMGEPGGLPSMWLYRVGHNWSDLAAAAASLTHTLWKEREANSHGLRGAAGASLVQEPNFDPWVRKIPWRREWQLQYSCQENSMDRGIWLSTVHGVAKN